MAGHIRTEDKCENKLQVSDLEEVSITFFRVRNDRGEKGTSTTNDEREFQMQPSRIEGWKRSKKCVYRTE